MRSSACRLQEKPEANGERVVLSSAALWMNDLSQAAIPVFEPLGYRPPHKNAPSSLLRFLSWFMPRYVSICHVSSHIMSSSVSRLLGVWFTMEFVSSPLVSAGVWSCPVVSVHTSIIARGRDQTLGQLRNRRWVMWRTSSPSDGSADIMRVVPALRP